MTIRGLIAGGLMMACSASGFALAEQFTYRLSGVIFLGNDRSTAIIEMEDGAQRRFRKGDRVGGNRIIEILEKQVRLSIDDGEIILFLKGSRSGSRAAEVTPITADAPLLAKQVAQLSRRFPAAEDSQDRAAVKSTLNKMLGLPPGAIITAVNDERVGSSFETVGRLEQILQDADPAPVSFNVTGVPGTDRIYRFPQALNEAQN